MLFLLDRMLDTCKLVSKILFLRIVLWSMVRNYGFKALRTLKALRALEALKALGKLTFLGHLKVLKVLGLLEVPNLTDSSLIAQIIGSGYFVHSFNNHSSSFQVKN